MPKAPEILTVAQADATHPRNGGADLIELKDGRIFMVRMRINASDLNNQAGDDAPSDLVTQESRDGGRTWTEPKVLIRPAPSETAAYSPGLMRLRNGDILFRYEMYHRFVQDEPMSISAYACISKDECHTFSGPMPIFSRSENLAGSQGDLRQLSTGRIIVPTCRIEGTALQDDGDAVLAPTNLCSSGCFYSDDIGKTWTESQDYVYLPMRGTMEPKIEELEDGRLLMVMRTQLGSVFQSFSEDGGQTWSDPQTTGLPAPESCPGLRRIPQTGDLLLIWNDSPYDPRFDHYGWRTPLSLAVSKDDGRTWSQGKAVESEPGWEFTNPAIIPTRSGELLMVYEASPYRPHGDTSRLGRSRMDLRLAIIGLDWLYS